MKPATITPKTSALRPVAVFDLGNTRLKFGVGLPADRAPRLNASPVNWHATGAVPYTHIDETALHLHETQTQVIACSVTNSEREAAVAQMLASCGHAVHWFRAQVMTAGIRNGYADPTQLGADRWAAIVGAWLRTRTNTLVVSAGTATTIDLIEARADGTAVFRGGVILPGVDLMRGALASGTARLPHARGSLQACPDNTDDAIESGVLNAQLGAIGRLREQLPKGARCLITGGNAGLLLAHLGDEFEQAEALVLEALLLTRDSAQAS